MITFKIKMLEKSYLTEVLHLENFAIANPEQGLVKVLTHTFLFEEFEFKEARIFSTEL